MLQVKSELTGELADCTICQGIVLDSGERIGAIADVDSFAMYTVDLRDATVAINKNEGLSLPMPGWKDSDLWTVHKKGKKARFNVDKAKRVGDNGRAKRIAAYATKVASGVELFPNDNESE